MRGPQAAAWVLGALLALLACATPAPAASTGKAPSVAASRYCDATPKLTPAQQDKIFRFGAVIKAELQRNGQRGVLMARSGTDLSRLGHRYSHAGFSLLDSPETPWAVRQLYYDCDTAQPRIFDQGLLAFLSGTDEPGIGWISVVLLPPEAAQPLLQAALHKPVALGLLARSYSANAHAFSLRHQNCNQWLAELLATAWGALPLAAGTKPVDTDTARAQAQRWLATRGYAPSEVRLPWWPLIGLQAFIPWVYNDDHPPEDLAQAMYRVSMPASIEDFVRAVEPQAQRIEFCHNTRQVVLRRGWRPIAEGCVAEAGDEVTQLD
jgi:hypothetical protein